MMMQNNLPDHPEPFWRDSITLPTFPSLKESIKVDVGVVGGGITGLTTAYMLAQEGLSVALLDAGVILNGTTGHTTAKITAQHGLIYDELVQHFGLEKTKFYYEANNEAKEFVKHTINSLEIDCDFKQEDAILYTNSEEYLQKLEFEQKAYEELNIPHDFSDKIPLDIPVTSALTMKNQAQFHPLKYLNKLVEYSVQKGVKIFENTQALDIEYTKHPRIITENGDRITCRNVVIASHYPFYDGQGFYPARMYAERSYALGIKTGQTYPGGMYISAESPTRSIRSTPINGEDLWIIGGENHKTGQGQSTMKYYEALQHFAEQQFGIEELLYRWSAQDLTTLDKLPYIGPITKGQHSVLIATGYRKWGMTNGTIAAKILTDTILEKENPYQELYTPSRFVADPSIRKLAQINADSAKHLIKGKFENTENKVANLNEDEAIVTSINGQRTGIYKDKNSEIHMVDTTCTHMKCEVEWNSGERTWDCPCHGSRFSYTGKVMEGPAKYPLKKVNENE